jgi:hypothetical protein
MAQYRLASSSIYLNTQDAVVRYQRLRDRAVIVRWPTGRRLLTGTYLMH